MARPCCAVCYKGPGPGVLRSTLERDIDEEHGRPHRRLCLRPVDAGPSFVEHRTNQLLSLPDDTLLAVLAFLTPEELLTCRLACRRLRDICLHRDLWRHVELGDSDMVRVALRIAPCLGVIHARQSYLGPNVPMDVLAACVARTKCVVNQVKLEARSQEEVALATYIIRNLSAVGGVRKLDLWADCFNTPYETPLLKAVYCVSGLQELHYGHGVDYMAAFWCDIKVTPSLTSLCYQSSSADPFLRLLLRTHVTTLEDVRLYLTEGAQVPVPLLTILPRLRFLRCDPCDDLPLLLALPNLRCVNISVFPTDRGVVFNSGSLDFLCGASHLREVGFTFPKLNPAAPLEALASSRSAGLVESLILICTHGLLDLVAAALPVFPSLKFLCLDAVPSNFFLRAVSPTSAPNLTTLKMSPPAEQCAHAWLHDPGIQDLLLRNPRLHLCLNTHKLTLAEDCVCPWCQWGCHGRLRGPNGLGVAFSSHARRAGCPRACFQVARPPCRHCDGSCALEA